MKYQVTDDITGFDKSKPVFMDLETDGLYGRATLLQTYQEGDEFVRIYKNPKLEFLLGMVKTFHLVGHNIHYDLSVIQDMNDKQPFPTLNFDDTLLLTRLKYIGLSSYSLDNCYREVLNIDPYLGMDKKELQKSDWTGELTDEQLIYAASDVYYLPKLYEKVVSMKSTASYTGDIVTTKYFLGMQPVGIPFNIPKAKEKLADNLQKLDDIGLPINANSYKQVREYIGHDESDDLALAKLSSIGNERAQDVRASRKILKENSFINKFIALASKDPRSRLYGKFSPMAKSGRSVCKDINLQQIPRNLKNLFEIEDGYFVYSDFSQLELRCICAVSGDSRMEKLYREGEDLHSFTARSLFSTDEVTHEQRQIAKTANFGLLYGIGADGFAEMIFKNTGKLYSSAEADYIKSNWLALWQGIAKWQETMFKKFSRGVKESTPLGREYLTERATEYLNMQIQGMGAEVAKVTLHLLAQSTTFELSNFVHDSFLFITKTKEEAETLSELLSEMMKEAWLLVSHNCTIKDLPMPVTVSIGKNWADLE